MWAEFVVGSLLCSKRFFSGYSGFPSLLRSRFFWGCHTGGCGRVRDIPKNLKETTYLVDSLVFTSTPKVSRTIEAPLCLKSVSARSQTSSESLYSGSKPLKKLSSLFISGQIRLRARLLWGLWALNSEEEVLRDGRVTKT